MRQPAIVLLLAATLILSALPVRSYTLQFTDAPNSVQVKWPTRNIKVALSTSLSAPQSNIKPGSDVVGAARRALAHWAEAANIRFITFTSNAQSISAQGTRGDGLSLITVAHTSENAEAFAGEGSEVRGAAAPLGDHSRHAREHLRKGRPGHLRHQHVAGRHA